MTKAFTLFVFGGLIVSMAAQEKGLEVVPSVEISRYVGTWYEIARLPNRFQDDCAGDVTATYRLLEDGDLEVINRCREADGTVMEAVGRARRADDDEPNSMLEVRFAPAILSFLPFVWGNYWIIELADDYSYAVIGEPRRKYLWILSRSPAMQEDLFQTLLERIKQHDYDLTKLQRTSHTQ